MARGRGALAGALLISLVATTPAARAGEMPRKFPVVVDGRRLVKNDGSGTRFFVTGMDYGSVWGSSYDLQRYKRADVERIIKTISGYGGSAVGWRTFLKGTQLEYGADGLCSGMAEGAVGKIRHTLDTAYENGIVVLVTLSTAHFLRHGWGGRKEKNVTRVKNNHRLLTTDKGTRAYIENVVKPIASGLGPHPGLLSYLIVNEAGGMIRESDVEYGHWSDEFTTLEQMQRFVNRVAGAIHDAAPGALVSVAAVTFPNIAYWKDKALIAAGGHRKGVLDYYQVQFYPKHRGDDLSPFHNPVQHWGLDKPIVIGEFPCYGCLEVPGVKFRPSSKLDIVECYNYLYDNGYAGGLAWFYTGYRGYDHTHTAKALRGIGGRPTSPRPRS
ncbi:MAG: glycoside hydrolase 5 family protein [Planctomycetota bacterium]|jgi:hypothetical protein